MRTKTPKIASKTNKPHREKEVLLGLIEYFLETGKPVGSNTLKETGFDHLSSATIRNYFSKLEEDGYLHQQHTSGGRIPTEKALRVYLQEYANQGIVDEALLSEIDQLKNFESREISHIIRKCLEETSHLAGTAAFISAPRFDRDFVTDIKVIPIDYERCLCVLITDFGSVQSELIQTEQKLSAFSVKRIEAYLQWRLSGQDKPEKISEEEESFSQKLYNELMIRFLVGYTHFTDEEIARTGLSRMLHHVEFRDPATLASSLALFENATSMRHLLRDTMAHQAMRFWIGQDLLPFGAKSNQTSVLAIPYYIHRQPVGAFGLLGPLRLPYRQLIGMLSAMSQALSNCLTKNLYKFKLSFRQPERFAAIGGKQLPQIDAPMKMIEPRKRK